ncbi:MAG: hypothetical protein CMO80_09280 [Verrucomicrobiales bacterium]|nr:hypothetical protein [Verrucomicrobiales bacterium]|tara:strand:- start:1189 stop:1584 length:396 start_codon:yes stop_codon:yes gene_type:complete
MNMTNSRYRFLMRHPAQPGLQVENSAEFTRKCADLAVQWILHHQKSQPDGGVTAHVYFNKGRMKLSPSYPEVTGYIIPSLYDYAKESTSRRFVKPRFGRQISNCRCRMKRKVGFPADALVRRGGLQFSTPA